MNRRQFIAGTAGCLGMVSHWSRAQGTSTPIDVTVHPERVLNSIPDDFLGLGYEISSVASGVLDEKNDAYVAMVRRLGPRGVIRIGGNTSDYASFARDGSNLSAPKGTTVNEDALRKLGGFLKATGWSLIWGLNLGRGTEQQAVEEAQAVAATSGNHLLAFEIGNEPDLFGRAKHRPANYSFDDYLKEYRTYKSGIRRVLPNAPFAGPDEAGTSGWVTRFASAEGSDLKLLTHHYYRECVNPSTTLDKLLHPDPKLKPGLEELRSASTSAHVPFRICEVNSFCGGGKQGISDSFGAALWTLNYILEIASYGGAGVNMETGVNQLGWISWYSPIGDNEHGTYTAKPVYYGMLAFGQMGGGNQVAIDYDPRGVNLSAYAVGRSGKRLSLTVVNRDGAQNASLTIDTLSKFSHASVLRLTGPSLESTENITLGGSSVSARGEWKPSDLKSIACREGKCTVDVPSASAAIVTFDARKI